MCRPQVHRHAPLACSNPQPVHAAWVEPGDGLPVQHPTPWIQRGLTG